MYEIAFAPEQKAGTSDPGTCPICKEGTSRPVLTVKAGGYLPDDLDLAECAACGTMYFLGREPVLGYDFAGFEQDYWYNYVQNGAGITAMLEPLLAIGRPRGGDLLDIGCGFGFVPDFWQRSGLGQSVGLETSLYGKIGREKLGVEVIASYFNDAKEIAGRKFDYVYSSEVLEHVRDPQGFIREISAALKPDGILVLTTPCADGVSPQTDVPTISAILSPGFHYFVTRPAALERLVASCGYPHVLVRSVGNRLLCWASHSPLPEIAEGFSDWDIYFSYLEKLSRNPDPHVAGGALYRLLKDAINLGRYDDAERIYPFFEALAKSVYGIDFRFPEKSLHRSKARWALGTAEFPSWLGCGYLFAGRYLAIENAPAEQLASLYSAAVETLQQEIESFAQFAQEAWFFLPMAREHLAMAQIAVPAPAQDTVSNDYPIEFARTSAVDFAGKEICLFVAYVPKGQLLPGAIALVQALAASGLTVAVCCVVEDMGLSIELAGLDGAAFIAKRKNGGYDFAVWAAILAEMPEVWRAERLFFVNDSILGPLTGFDQMLERIRASGASFLALSESYHPVHHSQSYFFVLQKGGLSSSEVRNFWRRVRVEKTKIEVIEKYECGLLPYARDVAGLETEILFSYERLFPGTDLNAVRLQNPTHHAWEKLVRSGFPFIKAELLHSNPLALDINHWESIVAGHDGDVDLFKKHLIRMTETRGAPPKPARYEKWKLLRRMIGDDQFFELRDIWFKHRKLRRWGR
ncbi:MAG: methyltransferase domain-containing protein [Rhodobacterales bacterium]|nr:methyltransferase domain-containing protein [Rhodobacterales bacterium]